MKSFNDFMIEAQLEEGLRKRAAAAALGAALAVGGGGAAKAKTDVSGNVNVSRGAVAAKATDKSVKSAVSKAIAKPGTSHSASSEKGKTKTTVSGNINVSGRLGGGGSDKKEKKQKEKKEVQSKETKQRKVRGNQQKPKPQASSAPKERTSTFKPKNIRHKFKTKTRYAVPTGTKGHQQQNKRMGTSGNRTASGPNQVGKYQRTGDTKSGGGKYTRTRVVGDPGGSGSTGRTVSSNRFKKLFGKGGKYRNVEKVPNKLGKKYKM